MNNEDWDTYADSAVEFTDNDNNWTEDEHDDNDDQMALDIHWAMQEIYDYFDVEHDFQSFDNNDHMIDAFVHCYLPDGSGGTTRDNASFAWFLDGDQAFFFGDGESLFKPLGALDVVAHEYAHGVTHNFTGLTIDNGVESAMNEGLSDIWGAIIENEVAPEKSHWKIGEEIINVNGDDCLRNIQDPESSTANVQMANTFGDATYTSGNFYAKSGIMSHWFYLLSEGGDDTNDNGDDYLVYKLGLDVAAEVVFEGQTGHFGDVDNYTEARTAMIDAADNIFEENSFQSLQVANAWYAVGVGPNPGQVTLSGDNLICNTGEVITANNSPTGSTINWTTSSNLKVDNGQGTTTPTIKPKYTSSQGAGWVQANYSTGLYTTAVPRKDVWVGIPANGLSGATIIGPTCCEKGSTNNYFHGSPHPLIIGGADWYNWSVHPYDANISIDPNANHVAAMVDIGSTTAPGFYTLRIKAENDCGENPEMAVAFFEVPVSYCGGGWYMTFSPNPTTGETTLSIKSENKEQTLGETAVWELEIYSPAQVLTQKTTRLRGSSTTIQTAGWKEGVYAVRVKLTTNEKPDEILTGKLVVKK